MNNKLSKILTIFAIILFCIILGTSVKASAPSSYEIKQTTKGAEIAENGFYIPHMVSDDWTFCIQHGNPYEADFESKIGSGYSVGRNGNPFCHNLYETPEPTGFDSVNNYANGAISMVYTESEHISNPQHQDAAYIFAFSRQPYSLDETQYAIWASSVSNNLEGWSVEANSLAAEAKAYKDFYDSFHDLNNGTDNFNANIHDNTVVSDVKVGVNQTEGYYIVGPFKVEYPAGYYNGTNKFSWIEEMVGITQDGSIVPVEVLDTNGAVITKEQMGKDGNISLNNTDFYIKFYSTTAERISLKIKFGYLESCSADMYKYAGSNYSWWWTEELVEEKAHFGGEHTGTEHEYDICGKTLSKHIGDSGVSYYRCDNGHEYYDNSKRECDAHMTCIHPKKYNTYQYELHKEFKTSSQTVLHLRLHYDETTGQWVYANPNYANAEITLVPDGIDLTMELGGYVWIDQDNGKINEGNSLLDDLSNNEQNEVLPGAEVWLYEYSGENDNGTLKGITLTDNNGHYLFEKLNSQKKYYVKFVYNGMMYDNVTYNQGNPVYNSEEWKKTSKAQEVERQEFNNKFGEIRSYPANYEIANKVFGDELGNYNIAYQQEDIVEIFKEISAEIVKSGGNLEEACKEVASKYGNTEDAKRKVQFAADCRMSARTDTKQKQFNGADNTYVYPVYNKFTTTEEANSSAIQPQTTTIAGTTFNFIYPGQRYINYGIKARTTFDMALYKDVYKAEMSINGKTETYNYDQTVTAKMGVSESDYLNGLRGMYQSNTSYTNAEKTGNIDTGEYTLDTRREEVANGQSSNYNLGNNEKGDYQLNNDYTNLNTDGTNKDERLKIFVTYKIAIVNQSATVGAITEIVDYFDTNYEFVDAYIGNENGVKIGNVEKSDNSKRYPNTEYKPTKNGYKAIYLRPDAETRLGNGETQYMYVVLQLLGPLKDAGTLLSSKLLNNETLEVINLAEINGYKTYNSKTDNSTPGLVDIDSNPGNLNISNIDALTKENIINYPNIRSMYEDDTNRAPVLVYKTLESRTIAGTVFEDAAIGKDGKIWANETIHTNETRQGNGQLDNNDKKIAGVKVELVEIKDINNDGNEEMTVRSTTTTNGDGWYGFIGFLPGNYTVRYTYGSDDATAMNKTSQYILGLNDKSYNGQDYQSTIFTEKGNAKSTESYQGENILKYNNGESPVYWYTDTDNTNNPRYSDAQDDANRVKEVKYYSKNEYGKEIINHKAEVFDAYENPQQSHINEQQNRNLADELESKTYRYAYTPEMEVEIEYAKTETEGNIAQKHKIEGVDFGIVERPRSELVIDQDIARIKVVAADGVTVLFDSDGTGTTSNLQWVKGTEQQKLSNGQYLYRGGKIVQPQYSDEYDKNELVNIIMDEELISGAKLEVTYRFTVTNNSESDTDANGNEVTTRAKTIVNYVPNNLTFDEKQNTGWKVVKASEIQEEGNSTLTNKNVVDLSTQAVILETTTDDKTGLTKALKPGYSTQAELTLTKVLSAESTLDDLTYTNLIEIVEIDNTVGRYDHGATPGNQSLEKNPAEHDAAGASKYDNGMGNPSNPNDPNDPGNPPDGVIIITPPTGSTYIYYVIGITSAVILAAGIYLIKKFIIDRK